MAKQFPWGLGVNMREAAYYGWGPYPAANLSVTLDFLKNMGVKTVRFFASRIELDADECAAHVVATLDQLAARNMNAIVALTDAYSASGFVIKADAPWHSLNAAMGQTHKDYWLQHVYRKPGSYLDFAHTVVSKAKAHPGVLLWELGNEFAILPQPPAELAASQAFVNFVTEATQKIKATDSKAKVGIGLIYSRNVCPDGTPDPKVFARQIYGLVDAIGVHCYQDFSPEECKRAIADAEVAGGKNFYVGEIGALYNNNDRSGYYDDEIGFWKNTYNAFTVMPWQFDAQRFSMLRESRGVSIDLGDFDKIVTVMKKYV